MKRLLIALVAAVAVSTGFARVSTQQGFENDSTAGFTILTGDDSAPAAYGEAVSRPSDSASYPFSGTGETGFGSSYLEIDTGDEVLSCSNSVAGSIYFDMFMQFNPSATSPTLDGETKIAVYLNAASNLVVISGNDVETTLAQLAPGTWGRLTISSEVVNDALDFKVYLNGNQVPNDSTTFASRVSGTTIASIGFKGSGKLDNFVARTTDPFFDNSNMVANIGGENGERYATYAAALADALADGGTATINYDGTGNGTSISPYKIPDLASLLAFQDAVDKIPAARGLSYALTGNIALVDPWPGIGIQNGKDLANGTNETKFVNKDYHIGQYDAGAFTGTFDGQGYTISNFQMVNGLDYCGFFNSVKDATIKNLKIQYKAGGNFSPASSGSTSESGATFVGVAKASTLENLTTLEGSISCGKGIGGIVGYLMGGSTVDSCTNNVALSSLKNNKVGGIAMITQNGTGAATIKNCLNTGGVTTTSEQHGSIVGYVSAPTTVISNCCSTVAGKKLLYYYGNTLTVADVVGMANTVSYTSKGSLSAVGLNFATVSGDYAIFANDDELVAGNTYKVMSTKAAATYNFDAAGTIAFDTAVAVPASTNITADTTTLVLADPVTDGTVTTYAATAGVASVDNVAYANFADAVAALDGATDNYVTLLADVDYYKFSYGTTLKVKAGNHTFTPAKAADDVVLSESTVEGITTYTAVEGVAAVSFSVSSPWNWYATFEGAYAEALAGSGNALMKIKITDDFTPNISGTYNHFYSLRFEDVRADKSEGLTINLKNAAGTAYMGSSRYFFPDNAKLVLAADWAPWTQGLATGGTLEIPEGVTVSNFGSYVALEGLSSIVGAGTIAPSAAVSYYMLSDPTKVVPTSLRDNTWTGTLVVTGAVEGTGAAFDYVWNLGNYGNSGSTIRFNGVTTYLNSGTHSVGTIELVGDGLTINGNYSNGTWTFPGALTGSGSLNISIANASGTDLKAVKFTGDASEFAGSIDFGANANTYVQFGSEGVASNELAAKRIITGDDAEVTVASGKTWKADAFMLHGNVTLDGSLRNIDDTDAGVVWNNHSSAVFTVNAAGLFKFGNYESWTGTYVVNHSLASAATAFIIPTAENATTVINGDENGEFVGFPATGNDPNGPPTVKGKIVLNADWTTGDGWSTEAKATTFASLSGSGDLTVNDKNNYSYQLWYNITKLDGYTGTLGGRNGKFVIGQVNVAEMPTDGARVVKTACGTYGEIAGDLKLYVAGVDTGKTLTYVANGADGAGLYYFEPKVYVAKIEGGASYETLADAVTNATSGATVTLLSDIKLNARVEPNLGANTTLAINLGGCTITREGTSGNGSVFDVKSGNVVITNGTIDCTQENGGAEIDAITIRTGNLTLADLAITVDSKNGACVYPFAGATVTINGGTYRNNTAEEYQYKTGWTGMAVNQANVATQLITIYGGKFWQVDPKAGDDSGLCTSFLASGKTTTLVDGYWTVGDAATPVEPGQKSTEYDTAEAATNAMAIVEVAVPSDVGSALDAGQKADYVAMFEKKVVENGDGTYSVAVEMKDEVVAEVQTAVDAATATTLEEVLDVEAGADANVSVTTKPGLYYAIAVGTSLPLTAPASEAYEMATDTTKTLNVTKPTTGTAAFFRVYCSETK